MATALTSSKSLPFVVSWISAAHLPRVLALESQFAISAADSIIELASEALKNRENEWNP
ncbi:MAG: hypothetical protein HQM14_04745 [SAR324 cluster bacterium]|nr:hypothetical protein [SAR324 cluster bacterium]